VAHGKRIMLCERYPDVLETATRNTCDITAVSVLDELMRTCRVLDPSHAVGRVVAAALCRAGSGDWRRRVDLSRRIRAEKAVSDGRRA
jgi:3-deoxy-7-phosphoheptulonate synthase